MTNQDYWTVMVVDDHPLFRKGLKDLFSLDDRFKVVEEASSGDEGLEKIAARDIDLVLLDLNMKGKDGIATLKEMRQTKTQARIVLLTVSDDDDDVIAGLRAGADGYLLKDMEPENILDQLVHAMNSRIVISDTLVELLARALRGGLTPQTQEESGVTPRELEIINLIAQGMTNKHIARKLNIAEGTVKVHVKKMLKKLNLKSRVEIAVWSVEKL